MRIIINASNIIIGGGIQVTLSLLEELKNYFENEYYIFLSCQINEQINRKSFPTNFVFFLIEDSPSNIKSIIFNNKELSSLERSIRPDIVFSVFGPSYWKPKAKHISGFADGWCYTPDSIAFKVLSFKRRLKMFFLIKLKNFFIKKADFLIVETETAKQNIIKYLRFKRDNIYVVGNTVHPSFQKFIDSFKLRLRESSEDTPFKFLTLSSFYAHKNLSVINDVVKILEKKSSRRFIFYLTLEENIFKDNFVISESIVNLGRQHINDCPELYNKVDAMFLPTLLETFTANYPEAMKMERPILTSDLDFAHELCGDAAIYFNPLSPDDIVDKILNVSNNSDLADSLVKAGKKRFGSFINSKERCQLYLDIIKKIN